MHGVWVTPGCAYVRWTTFFLSTEAGTGGCTKRHPPYKGRCFLTGSARRVDNVFLVHRAGYWWMYKATSTRAMLLTGSDVLRRRVGRGPGPLEVETAQVAADVEHLADEVQPRRFQRLHGLRGDFAGIQAAQGHFGRAVALGAGRHQLPALQLFGDGVQFAWRVLLERLGDEPQLAQQPGHLLGEQFAQQGFEFRVGPFALLFGQPFRQVQVRQEVDFDAIARLPVGGNLQDRRAGQATVGEQDVLHETLPVAAHPAIFHRGTGQLRAQVLELRIGEGERHQPGTGWQHVVAELTRHLIAKAAGPQGGNRQAARGDHQRLADELAAAGAQAITAVVARDDGLDRGVQ